MTRSETRQRTNLIAVRVTPEEYGRIRRGSTAAGASMSGFLRETALGALADPGAPEQVVRRVHEVLQGRGHRGHPGSFAVLKVLELHRAYRIYDDCGHQPHESNPDGSVPPGMVELEGIGLVCEAGYLYSICRECCADVVEEYVFQSEKCVDHHEHQDPKFACWPCPTVRAIAVVLGVQL